MLDPKQIDDFFNASALKKRIKIRPAAHTRWVLTAKLALPSIAAILAVTLLCLPSIKKDTKEFGLDFTISQGDIEKLNIDKTTIYITDSKNRVNNLTAEQIKETQSGSQVFTLTKPEALLPVSNDEWLNIQSPSGLFSQQNSELRLLNTVEVFYSQGMNIQTKEFTFDFKDSFGHTTTPVTGSGFIGEINAEGLTFSGKNDVLTFTGQTHIKLNPESLKKE